LRSSRGDGTRDPRREGLTVSGAPRDRLDLSSSRLQHQRPRVASEERS
jgi:hypothetical protein